MVSTSLQSSQFYIGVGIVWHVLLFDIRVGM